MTTITLILDDGELKVSESLIRKSLTLSDLLDETKSDIISIQAFSYKVMSKVIEYLEDPTSWTVDNNMLDDVIIASDYLNIEKLYDHTCELAAKYLEKYSKEEIKKILGLPDDYTDDEGIDIENEWVEE